MRLVLPGLLVALCVAPAHARALGVFTPEQQALVFCGPFYGTTCAPGGGLDIPLVPIVEDPFGGTFVPPGTGPFCGSGGACDPALLEQIRERAAALLASFPHLPVRPPPAPPVGPPGTRPPPDVPFHPFTGEVGTAVGRRTAR